MSERENLLKRLKKVWVRGKKLDSWVTGNTQFVFGVSVNYVGVRVNKINLFKYSQIKIREGIDVFDDNH